MEPIIKKAIEGGYNHDFTFLMDCIGTWDERFIFTDPIFWQALGKACGWTKIDLGMHTDHEQWVDEWLEKAKDFHEINLTESWNKAIEYLEDLVK